MKRVFFSLFAGAVGCALALQFPSTAIAKNKEAVLYSFASGTDGWDPYYAGLIDAKGTLYGTTYYGGTDGVDGGTVFSVNPTTGTETVLHSFGSGTDGANPSASLIDVKGILYGTTDAGGGGSCNINDTYGCGTVFSLNPSTGAETVLHSFASGLDGAFPAASLIGVKDTLYGTTEYGGPAFCSGDIGCGTLFSVNPTTGTEMVVYSFCSQANCTDGAFPTASLIDVNGTLYGTTNGGGASYCCGTVFSLDLSTGREKVIHSFCSQQNCTDGQSPYASLIDVKGTLYGTTAKGGTYGEGTVFALNLRTGTETVLYSLCTQANCTDGANPYAGLIDVKGTLYGITYDGGANEVDGGTVFSVNPTTGTETVLHSFGSGTDGQGPTASLIDVKGTLYGTTLEGGTYGYGTVFSLKKL